jgi:hypothetical protein
MAQNYDSMIALLKEYEGDNPYLTARDGELIHGI